MTNRTTAYVTLFLATGAIGACGGGGGSDAPANNANSLPANGSLSVAITDAPVDNVAAVAVEFAGITVKPSDGEAIAFEFAQPVTIDLAALTGETSAMLLDEQSLPAGDYDWLRLDVNADCDAFIDSYVDTIDGARIELEVPSARGVQLSGGFTVTAASDTSFVIDWDLRKALVAPNGSSCYKLRPSLRVVDMTAYGVIQGSVAAGLVEADNCSADPNTLAGNAVYVFSGSDVTPDDIDGQEPDPLLTTNVLYEVDTATYRYTAAFLPPGDYTAAFTCQGRDDRVPDDTPAADSSDDIVFGSSVNATVVAGEITGADID